MTVRELLETLKHLDPEAEVRSRDDDWCLTLITEVTPLWLRDTGTSWGSVEKAMKGYNRGLTPIVVLR